MTVDRALFLFDGPNFYKNMLYNDIDRKHLDYTIFARNLALTRTVVEVILFTSPADRATDAENYANQQRFFAALQASGTTLKRGKLVSRMVTCPDCNVARPIKVEKSVDVLLAMEIVLRVNDYDTLYLASCDSDLIPAIGYVRSLGKKVFLMQPKGSRCAGVGAVCNSTITITQQHIDAAQPRP